MAAEAPTCSRSKQTFAPAGDFWADDEIIAPPDDQGQPCELRAREIAVMSPVGANHNHIAMDVIVPSYGLAREHRPGRVYSGKASLRPSPLICGAPDVAFVARTRLRALRPTPEKFSPEAPDLAVEILSTDDSLRRAGRKIAGCFHHGTSRVWLGLPRRKQIRVHPSARGSVTLEGEEAGLTGGALLPEGLFVDPAFN